MRNKLADAANCLRNFIEADESKAVTAEVAALIKAVHRNGVTIGDKIGGYEVIGVSSRSIYAIRKRRHLEKFFYSEWKELVRQNTKQKGKK